MCDPYSQGQYQLVILHRDNIINIDFDMSSISVRRLPQQQSPLIMSRPSGASDVRSSLLS